ncbi:MAG: DUF4870 domain-containing protein [Candidatus Woesearchaeota archaeon]|nr:MAG: DUF4870 domain-containing protein [Candidatus Woesearchaeota archaeon]
MVKSDNTTLLILTHVFGLFASFIGPLIVLNSSKDKEVKNHARVALNWQISMLIYFAISMVLMFIFVGFILIFVLGIINWIFCITAAVKASDHTLWKYPLSINFLRLK